MSSWPAALTSRLPTALFAAVLGCQGPTPSERSASVQASAPPLVAAPAAAPAPWFQGEWHGGGSAEGAQNGPPTVAHLVIDGAGRAAGSSTTPNMALTGLVDQDTVRVEAQGEGGHGIAVLHHRTGTLHGILHYAPLGAEQGARVTLTLTRGAPP